MNRPSSGIAVVRPTISTQATRIPISSSALITCWPGTASGRVGIRSWSLAKAMFEPQKETEPITAANRTGISSSSGISASSRRRSR